MKECSDSGMYNQDKLCLDECESDHGIDPKNSKLCIQGCFRDFDNNTYCNDEQSCEFVTEANKYICSED